MQVFVSFIAGLIMALGLSLSGMVNPQKVIGFLDVFGRFDPTLVFVMGGALLVTGPGYFWARRRVKPVLCDSFDLPAKNKIDAALIAGAAIFGIGWGLAGFCPGPALTGVGLGFPQALIFTVSMFVGMFLASSSKKTTQSKARIFCCPRGN